MAKKIFKKVTSPRGEALYAYLKKPEEYEGEAVGYTIQVKFSKEDTDKLIAVHEAELEAAKKSDQFKSKKWNSPRLGYREDKDGDIVFKFKMKHEFKSKAGETIHRTVPVFDAKGNPIDVSVGNGSTIRIAYQIIPYHKSSANCGLSLFMDAVQVIELVEYGGSATVAGGFGFEAEEGYEGKTAGDTFDEMVEGDEESASDGDF